MESSTSTGTLAWSPGIEDYWRGRSWKPRGAEEENVLDRDISSCEVRRHWVLGKEQELPSIHALRETSVRLDTHLRGLCSVTLMGLFVKVNGKLQKDLLFLSRHKSEHWATCPSPAAALKEGKSQSSWLAERLFIMSVRKMGQKANTYRHLQELWVIRCHCDPERQTSEVSQGSSQQVGTPVSPSCN